MIKYIKKLIKKYKLLAKYKRTSRRMQDDLHLLNMFKHNDKACDYFIHRIWCETRCYNRLWKLK